MLALLLIPHEPNIPFFCPYVNYYLFHILNILYINFISLYYLYVIFKVKIFSTYATQYNGMMAVSKKQTIERSKSVCHKLLLSYRKEYL